MQHVVALDHRACLEFEAVKGRDDRRAVYTVLAKLAALGADLPPPHMKPLKGQPDLFELRPRQGSSAIRPIYARLGERFVVLAIAKDKSAFDRAVDAARERLSAYVGSPRR